MAVLGMIVVAGAVKIRGHHGDEVRAILATQVLAILQSGDFCQSVGLVCLFERRGQQAVFRHGLRGHAGIDAA